MSRGPFYKILYYYARKFGTENEIAREGERKRERKRGRGRERREKETQTQTQTQTQRYRPRVAVGHRKRKIIKLCLLLFCTVYLFS